MSKQRELVERIRREEFGIGVELVGEAKIIVNNMVRKYRNLLSTVAEDLNSKESHFILELIQNADDNSYASNVDPSLSFSLEGNRLIVKNNEVGFQEKNIRALCSAGESSKKSEKRKGYIGEKGIGFKSIFKVTDSPEVHSNGYHFRFDRSNPEDLLGYVVPHWQEPTIQLDEQTTLVIPAKLGSQFGLSTVADVSDSLLLFLQKLRKLEVKTLDGQYSYQRKDNDAVTTLVKTKVGEAPIRQNFLRTTFKVDMSDISEPKREGIKEAEIVLAFPIEESGKAAPIPGSNTYAFLPIRDFGFNFYIQADFVLASSREAIHEELIWNIRLRDAISDAFIEAIEEFKRRPELAKTYLRYYPTKEEVHDPFFSLVVEQLSEKLKAVKCIPVKNGDWQIPSKVLFTSEEIQDLFPTKEALCIFGADYLQDGFVLPTPLKESLNLKNLLTSDVASIFTKHPDWIKNKSIDWKAKFYAYLSKERLRKSYVKSLEKMPCIPLEDGRWVIPSESHVFFPLSNGEKYGFEHELSILNAELLKKAVAISQDVLLLFSELDVKKDNPFDLIQSHILKIHKDGKWKNSGNKALIGHVRYIKDKFDQYLDATVANGQQKNLAISSLKDGLYIGSKNNKINDKSWYFNRVSELYLGKEFQPEFDLESILEGDVSPDLFVASEYINSLYNETIKEIRDKEIATWRDFFVQLGVNIFPRVIKQSTGNNVCSKELDRLLKSTNPNIRCLTLEILDRNWAIYSHSISFNKQPSGFVTTLRSVIAPTRKKVQVSLSSAYKDNLDTRTVLGDSVVFVDVELHNPAFLDACGITYKVDAEACLKRLRQIKQDNIRNQEQIQKIYRCFEILWDREQAQIKNAFINEKLIKVGGGESMRWVYPKEACWKRTENRFFDRLYPPLDRAYQDFYGFFVKRLKVPETISIYQLVEALKNFKEVEKVERPELAFFIYRRLSQAIDSHNKSGSHSQPEWVDDLDVHSLLLNRRGEMVNNSEHFYADDQPEISKLFDDQEEISFLNIPSNQLPAVKSLLNELKIQQISDMINIQVSDGIAGTINNRLTAKLREMLVLIARITYSQSNAAFESAIKTGLFKRLSKTNVLDVSSLILAVTLSKWSRETFGVSASRENEILLDSTTRSKHDYVAMEVEKILFKQRKVASAHISRVLMAESTEDANDYLEIQQIPNLPDDEMEKLRSSISHVIEQVVEPKDEEVEWIEANEESDFSFLNENLDSTLNQSDNSIVRNMSGDTRKTNEAFGSQFDISSHDTIGNINADKSGRVFHPHVTPEIGRQSVVAIGQSKLVSTAKLIQSIDNNRPMLKSITRSGRLLSYAEPNNPNDERDGYQNGDNSALSEHRKSVERAAVDFFRETQSNRWRRLDEMLPNNPGFDFSAESLDGNDEFIEIKGQSGAWTEEGIALTQTELLKAAQHRQHYWLCIVEFALDNARRRLWLIQNPFGKTNQFRFDRGWQDVAMKKTENTLQPTVGIFVTIPEVGKVKILEVVGNGLLIKLKFENEDKSTVTKTYNPATMILSVD